MSKAWCPTHGEVEWSHRCTTAASVAVYLPDSDANLAVKVGDYVVFDPTGRDLNDCLVVGSVISIADNVAHVLINGSEEIHTVDRVKTVLA